MSNSVKRSFADVVRRTTFWSVVRVKRRLTALENDLGSVSLLGARKHREFIDNWVIEVWQNRWDKLQNGRTTFQFTLSVLFFCANPDLKIILSLSFWQTGHDSLNAFLYKRGFHDTPSCMCGAPSEDWRHAMCNCCLYYDLRNLQSMCIVIGVK